MSCKALLEYVQKVQDDAERDLREWEEAIRARDLAEKRRLAPGWLDSEVKVLEPMKKAEEAEKGKNLMDMDASSAEAPSRDVPLQAEGGVGDELDRAFGGMGITQ